MTLIYRNGSGRMAHYVINLLGNIFELYITISFFSKFSTRRVSTPIFWSLCCAFTTLQFMSNNLFLTKSYLVMFGMVVFIFLISLLFNTSMLSRIFSSIFLYLLFALSELTVAMTITSFTNVELIYTQVNLFLFAMCTLLSKFLTLSIVQVLRFGKKQRKNWLPISLSFKIVPLPISTFIVVMLLFECCYKIDELKFRVITLISSLMLTVANIFVFYIIDKQNDYIKTKESLNFAKLHIQNQINHYAELYSYQNAIISFKHDTKNRLLSLLGLLKEHQTDKAIELLENDLNFLDDSKQKVINSGNPVIDAVIQSKSNIANAEGITINASMRLTRPIEIDAFELGVLIGNALDNAIEATQKVDADNRSPISVSLITTESHLSLSIKNAVFANVDTEDLHSTKNDKTNHGYGLSSIKAIVKSHGGEVFISCEANVFELSVSLSNIK